MQFRWWALILVVALAVGAFAALTTYRSSGSTDVSVGPKSVASAPQSRIAPPAPKQRVRNRAPANERDWFREITRDTGIEFRHVSGDSPEKPFPAANGSGVAAIDFDLDGLSDLYFATGTAIPVKPAVNSPSNRFYRNLGQLKFRDATDNCGLGHRGYSAGVTVGDFDADGFPDVYVACYGPNCLFHNLGDGTFEEVGVSSSTADDRWATSTAWFDYDNDSLLDLYVCNYGHWTPETNQYCGDRDRGVRMFCSPTAIEPQLDALFHNAGDGTFEDATMKSGIGVRRARGQGIVAGDVTGDGLLDIYVGNDLHPNSLFLNEGGGRFRDASEQSGTAYDSKGNSQAGMGVDVVDANRDGRFDLFVTNFQNENNCLYENLGGEFFRESSYTCGLAADSIPWVGWGAAFADFDFDGWLDVVITNGHVDDNRHLLGQDAPHYQPALLYKNQSGQFKLIGPESGDYFSVDHVGRGLILIDLENDGDQDVAITHQDNEAGILLNQIANRVGTPDSIVLRLVGTTSTRDGIGSLVTFRSSAKTVAQQIKGGGSYLSASDLRLFFAVSPDETDFNIEIQWSDGNKSTVNGLKRGQEYVIIQQQSANPSAIPMKEPRE